ncbi:ATP-grasp domain-containing protein [Tamlana fucoidanivorans]|uniref:ATP-grasp domain-containing protein n=1 Tax=Allotamlana fucoidanivorans TaxID=2583814 RepID=A0A5C4SRA7_9FLAO|nr:ATP-grasp domain-containing protein [Tamlana fucoidanivorans]TNJ46530.1 ATP-grasp domain-containing protein [Tamlana fucoidanivorans]
MNNILITSGGRRVSLVKAFMVELKKQSPSSKVIVSDAEPELSSAAQIADDYLKTFRINDRRYIEDLLKKCVDNDVSLLIPMLDPELKLLAKHKHLFSMHNILVVISDIDFIDIAEDKLKTKLLFEENGINTPQVFTKNNYKIPFFIKPINGSNSVENYIIKDKDQISNYFLKNSSLYFFEYLDHNDYEEYTCDLYYSKQGYLKCVIPRKRIEVRGGEVSKGVTKKNKIKIIIESKFSYLKGARGCITVQLFMHKETKEVKGIEINARFGGGFPLSYLAGGNFPKWIINEYLFNKEIDFCDDWEANVLMLRYDDEILVKNYET